MDRLGQLKQGKSRTNPFTDEEAGGDNSGSTNNFPTTTANDPANMQGFYQEIEGMKTNIEQIKQAKLNLQVLNQQTLLAVTNDREKSTQEQIPPIIQQTNRIITQTKDKLKTMNEETERLEKQPHNPSSQIRIRNNLVNVVTRKFVEIVKEYQAIQTQLKLDLKKKMKRQIQVIRPQVTNEEVDAMLLAGSGSGDFVKTVILTDRADDRIMESYAEVSNKYQEILQLEASMTELHQMFLDMAWMTQRQGELLDHIETHVEETKEHIDQANIDLVGAIELQKSIRYKQCCIAMVVLVVIAIIVAVLAAKYAPSSSGSGNSNG